MNESEVRELIESSGGTVSAVSGPLPDGSGFMIGSFPLPKDHWICGNHENIPPMPIRMGDSVRLLLGGCIDDGSKDAGATGCVTLSRVQVERMIRAAGRFAIRACTFNGADMDFDPDAMLQCLVVGMLGYHTPNGLSDCVSDPAGQDGSPFQVNVI